MAVKLPIPVPHNFESWNRALQGAYRKGAEACLAGAHIAACPYKDKRKDNGRLSWSRSFITAWRDGFGDAEKHQREIQQAEHLKAAAQPE